MIVKKKAGVEGDVHYRTAQVELTIGDSPVDLAEALRGKVQERQLPRAAASVARSLVSTGWCEIVEEEKAPQAKAWGRSSIGLGAALAKKEK